MASITKRDGRGDPWRVRYRDPQGKSKSKQFARKADAERFLITVEADKLRGAYVDPNAGKGRSPRSPSGGSSPRRSTCPRARR